MLFPARTPRERNPALVLPNSFSLALTTPVASSEAIYFTATQHDKCFWFRLNGKAFGNRENSCQLSLLWYQTCTVLGQADKKACEAYSRSNGKPTRGTSSSIKTGVYFYRDLFNNRGENICQPFLMWENAVFLLSRKPSNCTRDTVSFSR